MAEQLNDRHSGSNTTSKSESASCHREGGSSLASAIRPRSFSSFGCTSPVTSFSAAGSGSGLALISGALARLDAAKMMSLQGDARSRHISGEIMKRHLYESVVTTDRLQRLSVDSRDDNRGRSPRSFPNSNSFHSTPVTPFRGSHEASPVLTPPGGGGSGGSAAGFFRFFSRGTTPKCTTPVEEDLEEGASEVGLASLIGSRSRRHGSIGRCDLAERPDTVRDSEDGDCVPP